jgi:hypothetical protein
MILKSLGAVALLGAGMVVVGCKSAPDLTSDQAQTLIQANYDHADPAGASILVSDLGMREGITAKYWTRTTIYPNKYWADFKLTDDGKKVVKLPAGGDQIQWRPSGLDDTNYTYRVVTVAANHLRAHGVGAPADEMLPGADAAKGVDFTEVVDLSGVPDPLQEIARNPGNHLSAKRHADFVLTSGAWSLKSVQ